MVIHSDKIFFTSSAVDDGRTKRVNFKKYGIMKDIGLQLIAMPVEFSGYDISRFQSAKIPTSSSLKNPLLHNQWAASPGTIPVQQ